jgi:hypothetical protein
MKTCTCGSGGSERRHAHRRRAASSKSDARRGTHYVAVFNSAPRVAQFKLEALNILNRPNVRTLQDANTFGNANFGQTTIQVGFSRILQLMFRLNF